MSTATATERVPEKGPLTRATYVVADVETTGLDPVKDRVVQFALIRFKCGEPRERYSARVDPGIPIPPVASAVHLLRDADVRGRKALDEHATEIKRFVGDDVVVAHNAPFDQPFLPMIARPWICTLRLARKLWPTAPKHTNSVMRYYLGLDDRYDLSTAMPHDAEGDAIVTGALFFEQLLTLSASMRKLREVYDYSWSPILGTHLHFGKHYGTAIEKVPFGYLDWMYSLALPKRRSKISLDADTIATVQAEMASRLFGHLYVVSDGR